MPSDRNQFPAVPFAKLPLSSTADGLQLIGVDAPSAATVRISWDDAVAHLMKFVDVPAYQGAIGDANSMTVSTYGVYTYHGGVWRVSPAYKSNWGDLSGSPRFLLVDKAMTVSDQERSNAWQTLNIQIAGEGKLGMIKASPSIRVAEDGTAAVTQGGPGELGIVKLVDTTGIAASKDYVDKLVQEFSAYTLPIAGPSTIGGIMGSDTVVVNQSTGMAYVPEASINSMGVTMSAGEDYPVPPSQAGGFASARLVEKMIQASLDVGITPATPTSPGIVLPTAPLKITNAATGAITVDTATPAAAGVVRTVTDLASVTVPGDDTVPTSKAVVDYVDAAGAATSIIPAARLPIASTSERGAIRASNSVRVNEGTGVAYVPTATQSTPGIVTITPGINDPMPTQALSIKGVSDRVDNGIAVSEARMTSKVRTMKATNAVWGVVRTAYGTGDAGDDDKSTVPTVNYVQDYVAQHGGGGSWNGGTVANASTFSGGLFTPAVQTPQATSVINYAQQQSVFAGFWTGTAAQYAALAVKDARTLYWVDNSTLYIGSVKVNTGGGGGSVDLSDYRGPVALRTASGLDILISDGSGGVKLGHNTGVNASSSDVQLFTANSDAQVLVTQQGHFTVDMPGRVTLKGASAIELYNAHGSVTNRLLMGIEGTTFTVASTTNILQGFNVSASGSDGSYNDIVMTGERFNVIRTTHTAQNDIAMGMYMLSTSVILTAGGVGSQPAVEVSLEQNYNGTSAPVLRFSQAPIY